MTLGEFRKLTDKFPDHLDLFIEERITDFMYGLVESVEKKKINFSEAPEGKSLVKAEVIILSDN